MYFNRFIWQRLSYPNFYLVTTGQPFLLPQVLFLIAQRQALVHIVQANQLLVNLRKHFTMKLKTKLMFWHGTVALSLQNWILLRLASGLRQRLLLQVRFRRLALSGGLLEVGNLKWRVYVRLLRQFLCRNNYCWDKQMPNSELKQSEHI